MIIDCTADLHGNYPELHGGDLLIVGGDLTSRDIYTEYEYFTDWLSKQDYKKKIIIAGNHDNFVMKMCEPEDFFEVSYLCDSGTEFEGLKIWGSPWTKTFPNMNPRCKAFTVDTEEELAEKFALIPDDVDILVTHSPPFGVLDKINPRIMPPRIVMLNVGSTSLRDAIDRVKPRLHVFGHIHENGSKQILYKHTGSNTICINASYVNERYEPINKPVRVVL